MISTSTFTIGLDLGQRNDPSALAVVEQFTGAATRMDWITYATHSTNFQTSWRLRHLETPRLGTSYTDIVRRTQELALAISLQGQVTVIVEANGVGSPVVDMLKEARLPGTLIPVFTTTGDLPHCLPGNFWTVPKRDLIVTLQVGLEKNYLLVAPDMKEASTFQTQLLNIRVTNERYTHRPGTHDDLVMATALAYWWAKNEKTAGERGQRLI